jgi:GT2 family glycosyltransferase
MSEKRKIAICIPVTHTVPGNFFANFIGFWGYNMKHFDMQIRVVDWYLIDEARNDAIRNIQRSGYDPDYYFFLDADHIVSDNTLQQLIHADKDIVSAIYFTRSSPYYPVIRNVDKDGHFYIPTEFPANAVFPVDSVGAGCMLVKKKVIDTMPDPWFKVAYDEVKGVVGEDLYFGLKAKEYGFQTYVDSSCVCKHWGATIDEKPWNYYHEKGWYVKNKPHLPQVNFDRKCKDCELSKTMWKTLAKNPELQNEAYLSYKKLCEKTAMEKASRGPNE